MMARSLLPAFAAGVEANHEGRTLDDQGDGAIGEPLVLGRRVRTPLRQDSCRTDRMTALGAQD